MINGIQEINPIKQHFPDQELLFGILVDSGCLVSGFLNRPSISYSEKWEIFDPSKVKDYNRLPDYWKKVYDEHFKPERKDCVELKYRYIHSPEKIIPQYPHGPCKGIFVISDKNIKIRDLTTKDLIWIGDEFE